MDLHPVFVHFPISFLGLYGLMEVFSTKRLKNLPYWFYVKAVLVVIGVASSLLARQSGEMAGEKFQTDTFLAQVIEKHEIFANLTIFFFGISAAAYFFSWLDRDSRLKASQHTLWVFCRKFYGTVLDTGLVRVLAFLGFIFLVLAGGMGGAIARGPASNPFFEPIYNLLVK